MGTESCLLICLPGLSTFLGQTKGFTQVGVVMQWLPVKQRTENVQLNNLELIRWLRLLCSIMELMI